MATVLADDDLFTLPYEHRLTRLLAHGVGLWDVISACHREGSLDAMIKGAVPNDFSALKEQCPKLKRIFFNGKVAGGYAPRFASAGYVTGVLPSSSPAYATRSFEQKRDLWQEIRF